MKTSDIDSLLDEVLDTKIAEQQAAEPTCLGDIEVVQLDAGQIDPRLMMLSHSSRQTLHKCPRKYQLYRLASQQAEGDERQEMERSVTFSYGHAVGIGVQSALELKSEEQCLFDTFLGWDDDLLLCNDHQKKSIWHAIWAVSKFVKMRSNGFLEDYELVYYKGKPAIELSFKILLPDGFTYRGYLDGVLRNKETGAIIVLENKTSSGNAAAAQYKNSGQALGYSVVLDILFPELSSYQVLYMVYETRNMEYKQLPFTKSLLQRALWLQELVLDTQLIKIYNDCGTYPMHGEACYDFFRDCEYLSLCTLSTEHLTAPLTKAGFEAIQEQEDDSKYDFVVTLEDLIESQIAKGEE